MVPLKGAVVASSAIQVLRKDDEIRERNSRFIEQLEGRERAMVRGLEGGGNLGIYEGWGQGKWPKHYRVRVSKRLHFCTTSMFWVGSALYKIKLPGTFIFSQDSIY